MHSYSRLACRHRVTFSTAHALGTAAKYKSARDSGCATSDSDLPETDMLHPDYEATEASQPCKTPLSRKSSWKPSVPTISVQLHQPQRIQIRYALRSPMHHFSFVPSRDSVSSAHIGIVWNYYFGGLTLGPNGKGSYFES